MGGIPGDSTKLPFFSGVGSFAYVIGPQTKARFSTKPFTVDEPLYFLFSYFKSIQVSDFRVLLKRRNADEEVIFEAPKLSGLETHKWLRYDYYITELLKYSGKSVLCIQENMNTLALKYPIFQWGYLSV
jgi:hypothetical protein